MITRRLCRLSRKARRNAIFDGWVLSAATKADIPLMDVPCGTGNDYNWRIADAPFVRLLLAGSGRSAFG